jgi:outer membrane protein TolC
MMYSILSLLLLVLTGVMLEAQVILPRRLTMQEAVRLALKNNPELESSRLDAEKAHARVREAWGYTMPSIGLSGQYTQAIKKPVFYLPGTFFDKPADVSVPVEIGSTYSFNLGLSATQILFNGAVFIGVGATKVYSEAAEELYTGKRIEVVARARKSFYGVLIAREAMDLIRQSLANAEDNLKNVRLLRAQGLLSEYDELRATVGVENIRPAVIQGETNYDLALDALRNTIGLTSSEPIAVEGELAFQLYDPGILSSPESLLVGANSTLRALRLQRDVNQAFVKAERSNYLPTLVAFGNYQYQTQKNNLRISTGDFIVSSAVGLQLSLSIFQGWQTNARVDQATIEVLKTESQLVTVENNLRTALHASMGTLEQSRKRLNAQEKNVETAERGYKIVTARFLANAATQLEVNDAQLALTQARVNRIQAVYDYLVAAADLDLLLGRMPEFVKETNE